MEVPACGFVMRGTWFLFLSHFTVVLLSLSVAPKLDLTINHREAKRSTGKGFSFPPGVTKPGGSSSTSGLSTSLPAPLGSALVA